jgi:hypothetical protein
MSIPSLDQLLPWAVFVVLTVSALIVAVEGLYRARRQRQRWRYEDEAMRQMLEADRAMQRPPDARSPGEADDEAPGH